MTDYTTLTGWKRGFRISMGTMIVQLILTNTVTTIIHMTINSNLPATVQRQHWGPGALSRRHSDPSSRRWPRLYTADSFPPRCSHQSRPSRCCDKSALPSSRRPVCQCHLQLSPPRHWLPSLPTSPKRSSHSPRRTWLPPPSTPRDYRFHRVATLTDDSDPTCFQST